MNVLIVKNALFTLAITIGLVWLVSWGDFRKTAVEYPLDYLFLGGVVSLSIYLSSYTVLDLQREPWQKSAVMYFVFYMSVFGLFIDGQMGWTHSVSVFDKLIMAGLYIAIAFVSIIVPLVIGAIAALQAYALSISVENRIRP
ncbi:hypothetical protein [Vibrio sp. LaRot3]|uniref:hypothetical protein n=1 Tax=Vibrio sp. LaRot3 TaxID=2998829 RepID=UPI0022CE1ED8|nr:hypothetical protein [Vibrio sp. LaRot3]MDA0149631.1 hypothetical protein [Vibrio sp. LaRot3]